MTYSRNVDLWVAPRHFAQALFVAFLWGVNTTAVKFGVEGFPPIMMIAMRLTLVALLLAPFALRGTEGKFKYLFMLALVMGVATFSLFFSGLVGVDASVAAVILMLGVPFSTILAFLFLKDRPGPWRCLGLGIAFAGVVVIAGEPKTASNLGHVGLLIGSAFCWALGNVVAKKLGKVDIFWMTAWMALLASPILWALTAALETGQMEALRTAPWTAWSGLTFGVVGSSIVAYGLWYRLIKIYNVTKITPVTLTEPIFAFIAAWLLLSEAIGWEKILGAAITTFGVAIIMFRWKSAPPVTD